MDGKVNAGAVVDAEEVIQKQAAEEAGWGIAVEEKPKPKLDEAQKKEEEKPKEEETPKAKTDDELLAAKDDDLSDDEKSKKSQLTETKRKEAEAKLEEEVQAYAKEYNLSVEEARKDYQEHIPAIEKKYNADPKQLSKANLHLQRLYTKTQDELKKQAEARVTAPVELTTDHVVKLIDDGQIKMDGKPADRDKVISL